MADETIVVKLSDTLAQELKTVSQDFIVKALERGLRELKIEQALERYSQGGISFGAAARQAGVSTSEFARQAHAQGMEPPYSDDTLNEELS